jgi:hypothetical protein
MENKKQLKDVNYHAQMLAAMIRNESYMKAIISLLIDIRSKITDEPISEIATAIENKIDDWQRELQNDIIIED